MVYEDDLFVIYYNECDKRYLDLLIKTLSSRISLICNFFKITYDKKIVIKLYNNIDEYRNNLEESFKKEALKINKESKETVEPRKFQDWMIANTEDGNINMQSLNLVKTLEDFKNYTEEEFCYNACYEFVNLCQTYLNSENPGWFWKLIATNIGNPEVQNDNTNSFTLNDLDNFDEIDGYGIVYTFGKYLFEKYDNEKVLTWVKNNDVFMKEIPYIIDEYNNLKRK